VSDSTTTAETGTNVALDSRFSAIPGPVTFRFYGYNAEGSSGTFSVDNVAIAGSVEQASAPLISVNSASDVTTAAATLNSTVNPQSNDTTVYFLFGQTTDYGSVTSSGAIPGGTSDVGIQRQVNGLKSYTTYHYKVIAANSIGVTVGPDQTFTTVSGDRDVDGLPDDYEVANGLNPDDPSDASVDRDGDGFTTSQEYAAGTNPNDANSRLQILTVNQDPDGYEIMFTTVPGKQYRVERTDALPAMTWTSVADDVSASGVTLTVVDDSAVSMSQRFYRVTVVP